MFCNEYWQYGNEKDLPRCGFFDVGCRGMRSGSCSEDPVACPADWEDVEVWNNPAFLAKRVAEEQELLVLTALLSLEGVSSLLPSEPGSE